MLPASGHTAREIKRHLRRTACICLTLAAGMGVCDLAVPASSHAWAWDATLQPTITGIAQQGQTLTATPGSWAHSPSAYSYQWLRCAASGESCVPIAGATAQTYVPVAEDVGRELRVQQASEEFMGHFRSAWSAATAVVLPVAPSNTAATVAPRATPVVVASRPVTVTQRGEAQIALSCPAQAREGCRGTVTIRLAEPAARRAVAARCARGCRPLGSANYEARAGKKIRVRVHIASVGRHLLARRKALRVRVVTTSVSGADTSTTVLTTTLRAAVRVA